MDNKEKIKNAQKKELFYIGFYFLRFYYYLSGLGSPLEREMYLHKDDNNYIFNRKKYHWRTYGEILTKRSF